ncbi:hypothetical protein P9239_15265 [Caballeronia sp. LZ062]|uniref:hypothetical protein n=1 Tax=unclassified Caballeronia TaxID=2646786 RepID=UPI00285640D5|nr:MULTISPECIES: hypothetical protein [unclassified Caballeronia]MDR5853767.1 hypothetical protein [Caballeronia sp. LZ050]MDR5871701.1 hypothetical protein [Caballeronia sp. LZ062]
MKRTIRTLALALTAFATAACASDPRLLDQHALKESAMTPATKVLVVLDSKALSDPTLTDEIHAYTNGMTKAVQDRLAPVRTELLDLTATTANRPAATTLVAMSPSHLITIAPAASSSVNGMPVRYTWVLQVADVSITRFPAIGGKPSGISIKTIPIYDMHAEGDACFLSARRAQECGTAMGKLLGDTLRAAPDLPFNSGS